MTQIQSNGRVTSVQVQLSLGFHCDQYLVHTIFSNGCLGSHNDEERSEMWYVLWIAKPRESFKIWTPIALPVALGVCLSECQQTLLGFVFCEQIWFDDCPLWYFVEVRQHLLQWTSWEYWWLLVKALLKWPTSSFRLEEWIWWCVSNYSIAILGIFHPLRDISFLWSLLSLTFGCHCIKALAPKFGRWTNKEEVGIFTRSTRSLPVGWLPNIVLTPSKRLHCGRTSLAWLELRSFLSDSV